MVIGVTAHDMFTPLSPDWRFVFGLVPFFDQGQSYAVISTARMGNGPPRRRRLDLMALRYVGRGFFRLPTTEDAHGALRAEIRSLEDLDEMRPKLADRPLTATEARALRLRVFESLSAR